MSIFTGPRHYYLPWNLEQEINSFVHYYNHERVHESLDNMTPADVYHGRAREIQTMRSLVKEHTLLQRRRKNLGLPPMKKDVIKPAVLREKCLLTFKLICPKGSDDIQLQKKNKNSFYCGK